MESPRNVILLGDVLDRLRELPDGCVQTVVTSPPYFGLRDYGVAGQIGLEPTPAAFVARMVEVFREVRRVLRDDGTCWVNLGDSYAAGGNGARDPERWPKQSRNADGFRSTHSKKQSGLKPKDLIGIPWRVAFALQDDGWWLRSDIVWSKPNPMPESVTDRPTRAHEYIFLLSKRERYYYDAEAIREPLMRSSVARLSQDVDSQAGSTRANGGTRADRPMKAVARVAYRQRGHGRRHDGFNARWDAMPKAEQQALGANKRTVWTVATHPYAEAHFATFPPKLIEPCILSGSSPQACEYCGAPWRRVVEAIGGTIGQSWHDHTDDLGNGQRVALKAGKGQLSRVGDAPGYQRIERGWQPTCRCEGNTGTGRCLVLDPFMGSGTVALVAQQWQRDYLGIELNPAYIEMAQRRLATVQVKLFAS